MLAGARMCVRIVADGSWFLAATAALQACFDPSRRLRAAEWSAAVGGGITGVLASEAEAPVWFRG